MAKHLTKRLKVGSRVLIDDREHTILDILGSEEVKVLDRETNRTRVAKVSEIQGEGTSRVGDIPDYPDADWVEADRRYEIIRPLLEPGRTSRMVHEAAKRAGKNPVTLYRWIKKFEATEALSSLIHKGRSDKGSRRLIPEVEQLINEVVQAEYLTVQRKSIATIVIEIRGRCLKRGIKPPHGNTIRNRIDELSAQLKYRKRYGAKKARQKYGHVKARTEAPAGPWAVMEMDTWNPDVIVVDDVNRMPLGRPYAVFAVDEYSRMILGFYVSMDAPSSLTTGLALIHAALRKAETLVKYDLDYEWPCYGLPKSILSDNGIEFRNKTLERACKEYGINLNFRPLGTPQYGGIIENFFETLNAKLHETSGTTFSNPQDKGDFKSKPTLTLFEFERTIAAHILGVHHEHFQDELAMSPRRKFELGIRGSGDEPGVGLPQEPSDLRQFRLDFMPYHERTIQRTGVQIDNIDYWESSLQRWINEEDPTNKKLKRKFTFRYDPRNMSRIWFLNPETREYEELGYRDKSHPALSQWELREIARFINRDGKQRVDEEKIFDAYQKMKQIIDDSKVATRKVHLAASRAKKYLETAPAPKNSKSTNPLSSQYANIKIDGLKPFDD